MSTLRAGQRLRCVGAHAPCEVLERLDEGGQGGVYRVTVDGRWFALKWYNNVVLRVDRGLRRRLQVAIDHGAPSDRFLWPFELVTLPDGSRLGYLMRLRDPRFVKLRDVLTGEVSPDFRVLAKVGWRLTDALFALHGKGLAYQDLNPGNVFFDPSSGEIEICDNDNVDIDGAPSVMGGVWEFQAPEVVHRRAGPSRVTDLHSLAVMLFRLLHIGHPLVGRRELELVNIADEAAMRRLYGDGARFVFDPVHDDNRPVPELHGPVIAHWALYPASLKALFERAFTVGLVDPQHGRVQESEWRVAMRRLLDAVTSCTACGAQSFYDPRRLAEGRAQFTCWHCAAAMSSAPLRIGLRALRAGTGEPPSAVVVAEPGASLFGHHTAPGESTHEQVTGLVEGPSTALRNVGGHPWRIEAGTETLRIEPGASVPLRAGQHIVFGTQAGDVRA